MKQDMRMQRVTNCIDVIDMFVRGRVSKVSVYAHHFYLSDVRRFIVVLE